MKREEVKAKTRVDWYYIPKKETDSEKIHVGCSDIIFCDIRSMCVHSVYFFNAQLLAFPLS